MSTTNKRHITFFCEADIVAGAEKYLSELVKNLNPDIFEVSILFNSKATMNSFLSKFPIPFYINKLNFMYENTLSSNRSNLSKYVGLLGPVKIIFGQFRRISVSLFYFLKIYKAFKDNEIDILHVNNGGYPGGDGARICILVAKLLKIKKIILVIHNSAIQHNKYKIIDKYIDSKVLEYSSRIICVSNAVKNSLYSNNRFPPSDKIQVIYNGIPLYPLHKNKNSTKEEFNIPLNKFIIGMVASFEKRKGHIYLLKAFKKLLELENGSQLILVGDHTEGIGPELIKESNVLNISDSVVFLGFQKDVIRIISCFNILIVPSVEYESFGLVLVEAMSQSVPTIATNVGGIPEVVKDGFNGLIIPPKNVESLHQAIVKIAKDQTLALKLGQNGRKIYQSKFLIDTMVEKLLKVYN